jgi:hypothetical protein
VKSPFSQSALFGFMGEDLRWAGRQGNRLFRCPLANAFGAREGDDDDLVFDLPA